MSIPINWRQFQLFDYTPIKDPNYATEEPLYSDSSLSSLCATSSYLICSSNSFIKIISNEFKLLKSYLAYEAEYIITFIREVHKSNLLVTIGERQGYPSVLKLWDLHKILHVPADNDALIHKFQTQVIIQNENNSYPISCFTFNDDLTCIAIGYTDGKVILIRGDLLRDRGSKQRIIYEANDPITGIHYNKKDDLLYATTTSRILTFVTTGRNQGKPLRVLSGKMGVDLNCSDIDEITHELVVGTRESIRFYNPISKGHTLLFEIPKKQIFRFQDNYLLIVAPYEELIESTKSKKLQTRILIIDLLNKHISFNLSMPNITVSRVFSMWNDVYYLTSDGILYKLHEKPINQQVELLLQREMFPIAYNLAIQSKLPVEILLNIQKEYGYFLYDKQDNDEAIVVFNKCLKLYQEKGNERKGAADSDNDETIDEFIMTIITKFKDAANIKNLTKFLYELFKLNLANNDHITLLLCCYCKLKMKKELDKFIDKLDLDETSNLQELNFQLIINLFKECGYFQQVIKLLYKLNQPALIVGIQLNELKKPRQSLNYMKTLSIDELLLILIEHSKILLDYLPIETTELLIKVFTGSYIPLENKQNISKISETQKETSEVTNKVVSPLKSYKAFLSYLSGGAINNDDVEDDVAYIPREPTYLPPRPNLIFPSFIDNPNEFVIFLEACLDAFERYQGNINDKKELLVTLVEMYLSLSKKDQESDWMDKARNLVDQHAHLLDNSSLLLVSHIYNFKEGEVISKEESGYEESLFRTCQLSKDIEGCLNIVQKYGESIPDLYRQMLKFMVSEEKIFARVSKKDFQFILNKIKTLKIASPLEIIQILGNNNFTTIELIRDYLIEFLEDQDKEISNNTKLTDFYEAESTKNNHQLTELISKPFVIQNNKCCTCELKLDFPMVHFKCKHSFHQKCINENLIVSDSIAENARLCPLCINEIDEIKSIRNLQLESKNKYNAFKSSLDDASDKLKFISEYIGNGAMENEYITLNDE